MELKRSYSSHDIEKAVEMAEENGLEQFLDQHPYEKRGGTQTAKNGFTGEGEDSVVARRNIFDIIMFGSPSPNRDQKELHSDDLTIKETHDSTEDSPISDDNLATCDPCEEVREIVRGIRAGKYRLKTTAYQTAEDTESYYHSNGLRLPEHWVSVNRNSNTTNSNDEPEHQSTYGDDGNMWALKVNIKNS